MELEKEWIEMFKNLKYSDIQDNERELDWEITFMIMADKEAMKAIDLHHKKGEKCAVIVIYDKGEMTTLVGNEILIKNYFDYELVSWNIDNYDPKDSFCMIYVRNGRISASAVGNDRACGSF